MFDLHYAILFNQLLWLITKTRLVELSYNYMRQFQLFPFGTDQRYYWGFKREYRRKYGE